MKWISVEDRLPETEVEVLVIATMGNQRDVFFDVLYPHGWGWTDELDDFSVTHWMYLPEIPSGDEI